MQGDGRAAGRGKGHREGMAAERGQGRKGKKGLHGVNRADIKGPKNTFRFLSSRHLYL